VSRLKSQPQDSIDRPTLEELFDLSTRYLAGSDVKKQKNNLLIGSVQVNPVEFEKDF